MIMAFVKGGRVHWNVKGDPITVAKELNALSQQIKKCGNEMRSTGELIFSPVILPDAEPQKNKTRSKKGAQNESKPDHSNRRR